MMACDLSALRVKALTDPTSSYYLNLCKLLAKAQADATSAAAKRKKVVIPFKVDAASVVDYERRFGWRIVVENHGLRSVTDPHVAGLAFCMALRNAVALGRDGEEVVALDADLPSLVAKGMAYVKVVRTSSSSRLQAAYALEDSQLQRLAESGQFAISGAAAAVLDEIRNGGGSRVFLDPSAPGLRADTLLVDHTKTSVSLRQVVVAADAWGATMVRGVCFFQPEMLVSATGPLSAFKGEYVIDEERDLVAYVPDACPEASMSHSWSALRSFFMNHECVHNGRTWLVEKHLGNEGIFHYVARLATEPWMFPEELGANYYSADMLEWVELQYPTRGGAAGGVSPLYWRRDAVRIPKRMYDGVMATLMAVEAKRLTKEEVLSVMRNYNHTYIVHGDTVRKPNRIWADMCKDAAVPLLALATFRRASASAELSKMLSVVRTRYNVANAGMLALLWNVACAAKEGFSTLSMFTAFSHGSTLSELESAGVDLRVLVRDVPTVIEVKQVVGAGIERDCGELTLGMPTGRSKFVDSILAKARAFMAKKPRVEVAVESDDGEFFDANSELEDSGEAIPVVEVVQESRVERASPEGVSKKLFEKLLAEQDATLDVRPPRVVHTYEGTVKDGVPKMPVAFAGITEMQDDYDDGMPGVSEEDAEMVPYIAAESDVETSRHTYMNLNDAKRELPAGKWIRRAKTRGGAAGMLPRSQAGLLAAMGKRNTEVPSNRESVDFLTAPAKAVEAIRRVCFVDNWRDILNRELGSGLWQPTTEDLREYVSKVDGTKAEALLKEFFSVADVDMKRWLVMAKSKAKPPVDELAHTKVPLPQTIMYNESKGMNAMYSSILSRFHDATDGMLRPQVKFNDRKSPAEHEMWFNTLEPLRKSCKRVYGYHGDSFNFDRSLELMAFTVELEFYRTHGLNAETLELWKETMGVKQAVSLMYGIVMHIVLQGLSGIFKTIFRNGLVTLASVVECTKVTRDSLVSLDVKGDDYTIETNVPIDTGRAVKLLAWKYNFSAKLSEDDYLWFCSKVWIKVDDWWYWVTDPVRKFESVSAAQVVNDGGDECLAEKWVSLRDDLRLYDDGIIMEQLALAVYAKGGRSRPPYGLVGGLSQLADDKNFFMAFYGAAEKIG